MFRLRKRKHEGQHDLIPWMNYYLGVTRRAYSEFEERSGSMRQERGAKTSLVETAVESSYGDFSLSELEQNCPGVSRHMIRRLLHDWKNEGLIEYLGKGPGAKWRKKGNTLKRV